MIWHPFEYGYSMKASNGETTSASLEELRL